MGFFSTLFGGKKPDEEHKTAPSAEGTRGLSQAARAQNGPPKDYSVRCWVETISPNKQPGMFPLEAKAKVSPAGLTISFGYEWAVPMDGMSKMMQYGIFQTLSDDDTNEPILMKFDAIEKVTGKFYSKEGSDLIRANTIEKPYAENIPDGQLFRIELIYNNAKKGSKLSIDIVADNSRCEEDPYGTLELYNEIVTTALKAESLGSPARIMKVKDTASLTMNNERKEANHAGIVSAFTNLAYLRSLDISPDENLVCFISPGGSVAAHESGSDKLVWTHRIANAEASLCRFVGKKRLLAISEIRSGTILMQLLETENGKVLAEKEGPGSYNLARDNKSDANADTGAFICCDSFNSLLCINTEGDKIEPSIKVFRQIESKPRIGPDGRYYATGVGRLFRMNIDSTYSVISEGANCICFDSPNFMHCGGGYRDRSGDSSLHTTNLKSGEISEIPWGREPIDEIALAGDGNLLLATKRSESYAAVVSLLSMKSQKPVWRLSIEDLDPWRSVILATEPEAGWGLIQTGRDLRFIGLDDGKALFSLPKDQSESINIKWLVSKNMIYIARSPDQYERKEGILECYRMANGIGKGFPTKSERKTLDQQTNPKKCAKCGRDLVFTSDRQMLSWVMSDDRRGDAVAHKCPKCGVNYCFSCMLDTKKSCPACGSEVVNAS